MFYLPDMSPEFDPEKGTLIVLNNCFRFNSAEGQQAVKRQRLDLDALAARA